MFILSSTTENSLDIFLNFIEAASKIFFSIVQIETIQNSLATYNT